MVELGGYLYFFIYELGGYLYFFIYASAQILADVQLLFFFRIIVSKKVFSLLTLVHTQCACSFCVGNLCQRNGSESPSPCT